MIVVLLRILNVYYNYASWKRESLNNWRMKSLYIFEEAKYKLYISTDKNVNYRNLHGEI